MPASVFAAIGVPSLGQCLQVLAPIAGILLLRWVFRNTDSAIRKLFPSLEWHRQLGWLNIRSERRAAAFLRVVSLCVYALLVLALCGVVWSAAGLAQVTDDASVVSVLAFLPVLVISLGVWVAYLGWELCPKLQREYEAEALERFRAERAEAQPLPDEESRSRVLGPLLGSKSPSSRVQSRK